MSKQPQKTNTKKRAHLIVDNLCDAAADRLNRIEADSADADTMRALVITYLRKNFDRIVDEVTRPFVTEEVAE